MRLNIFIPLLFITPTSLSFADAKLTLKFHIATAANSVYSLGGTIQNTGDQPIHSGYINFMTSKIKCTPGDIDVFYFNDIKPGQKYRFKIPLPSKIISYKILSFGGVDLHGLPVITEDETSDVISKKTLIEKKDCID